jgi:hypothetical protein
MMYDVSGDSTELLLFFPRPRLFPRIKSRRMDSPIHLLGTGSTYFFLQPMRSLCDSLVAAKRVGAPSCVGSSAAVADDLEFLVENH